MARLVFPVFAAGLELRERLRRGETPDLAAEQARLVGLLKAFGDAKRNPPPGGDGFLGPRYALACWLDDLFARESDRWFGCPIETAAFGMADRVWRFWEQAELADRRPDTDALEVFYLAVRLGFRGDGPPAAAGVPPERSIPPWLDRVEARLTREGPVWPEAPKDQRPAVNAGPRRGRRRLRRALILLIGLAALLLTLLAHVVAVGLGGP
jgi:hypothetical protein